MPFFRDAAEAAASAGLLFLRVDALHMLAIADTARAETWTAEALDVLAGATDDRTRRWAVALHNNVGWVHFDAGRFQEALTAFGRSRDAAQRWGTPDQVLAADEAIVEARATIDPFGR